MKKFKLFSIIQMLALIIVGLSACSKNPTPIKSMDFEPNNGSAVITITYENIDSIVPPNPANTNFTFDGWFWDDGIWNKPFTINSILDQPLQENMNLKVYAKWIGDIYKINYHSNYASEKTEVQSINFADNINLYNDDTFSRTGYRINNWNTLSDGSGTDYELNATLEYNYTKNIDLYAIWQKCNYKINYHSNNGQSQTEQQNVDYSDSITLLDQNTFTRLDYVLIKWNTQSNGNGTDYDLDQQITYTLTSNLTLYAIWQKYNFKINYYSNNGGQPEQQNAIYNTQVTILEQNSFTRIGSFLQKWNTQSNGSGTDYNIGQQITYTMTTDLNLYAIWQLCTYSIIYDANSGTGTMSNSTHIYGTSKNLSANTYEKEGHAFSKWNTQPNGDGVSYNNNQSVLNLLATQNASITLYAQWTVNKYSVTVTSENISFGTVAGGGSYDFGAAVTITATPNEYYKFDGWYSGSTLISDNAVHTFYMSANNLSYQAKWIEIVVKNDGKNIYSGNKIEVKGPELEDTNASGANFMTYKNKLYTYGKNALTIIDLTTGEVDKIVYLLASGISMSVYNDKIAMLVNNRLIQFYNISTGMLEEYIMLSENVSSSDSYFSRPGICYYKNYIYYSANNLVKRYNITSKTTTTIHTETNAYLSRYSLDEANKRMIIAFDGKITEHISSTWIKVYNLETDKIIGSTIQNASYVSPVVENQFISNGRAYTTLDGTLVNDYSAYPKRFAVGSTRYNLVAELETSKYIVFNYAIFNKSTNSFEFTNSYSYYSSFPMDNGEVCFSSSTGSVNLYSTFGYTQPKTINVDYTISSQILEKNDMQLESPSAPLHEHYDFVRSSSGNDHYIEKHDKITGEVLGSVLVVTYHTGTIITLIGVYNGYLYLMGSKGYTTPPSDCIIYKIEIESFEAKEEVYRTTDRIFRFYLIGDKIYITAGSSSQTESTIWTLNLITEQITSRTFTSDLIVTFDYSHNKLYVVEKSGNKRFYEIDLITGKEQYKTLSVITFKSYAVISVTTNYVFIGENVYDRATLTYMFSVRGGEVYDATDDYFINVYGIWDTKSLSMIYRFNAGSAEVSGGKIIDNDIYVNWNGWRKITMPD